MKSRATARERFSQLADLAGKTGSLIYQRAKLATETIDDRDFIAADPRFKGDLEKAISFLQDEYFADLGGLMSVTQLANVYRMYPEEEEWKERRFSLKKMYADWLEKTKPARGGKATRGKPNAELIEEQAESLRRQEQIIQSERKTNQEYQSRVRELEIENATLKGRIAELERQIGTLARKAG